MGKKNFQFKDGEWIDGFFAGYESGFKDGLKRKDSLSKLKKELEKQTLLKNTNHTT
jgi:hypothetical protein